MSKFSTGSISSWHLTVAICGMSVVFLWPTWGSLHETWLASSRYSHGHLVLLISAYFIFVRRGILSNLPARPCLAALLPLAVLLTVWLVALLASFQAIHQVLIPLILWTMLLVVLGWNVSRHLLAPVAYMYLAIPIWESGNFLLQWMTVKVVALGLWVFQVPAFVEGYVVHLPAGAFEVEGGCSGMHYLTVAIALSVFYGLLYVPSKGRRLLLIVGAIGMALLTNWLRVFAVVYAGHLSDMQHYLVTHDHYYFGWALFALILVPYLMFARRVERSGGFRDPTRSPVVEPDSSIVGRRLTVAFSACLVCLAAPSIVVYNNMRTDIRAGGQLSLPSAQSGWTNNESIDSDWRPYYVGATAEATSSYVNELGVVNAYGNLYAGQIQGEELVGYENRIEGIGKWSVASQQTKQIGLGEQKSAWPAREIELVSRNGERRLLYLWYDVGGQHAVSDFEAKILYGINVLRGERDAGVRILSAGCGRDCDDANSLLHDWLNDHIVMNGGV